MKERSGQPSSERRGSLTSARRIFHAVPSLVSSLNRRTSFVRAVASTAPVKKSPPRMRAIRKPHKYQPKRTEPILQTCNSLRRGGFAAAFTASNRAEVVLVYADSVAYVPSARTLGLPPPSFGLSSFFPLPSPSSPTSSVPLASSSNLCSDANIGISPNTFLISRRALWISERLSTYSPRIHRTPRKTLPDLISPRVWISLSQIVWRRCGNFSTTSLFIHT